MQPPQRMSPLRLPLLDAPWGLAHGRTRSTLLNAPG